MIEKKWLEQGFIDEPIPEKIDINTQDVTRKECTYHGTLLYGGRNPRVGRLRWR